MVRVTPDGPLSAPAGLYDRTQAGPAASWPRWAWRRSTRLRVRRSRIPEHRVYKYLLRAMVVDRPNQGLVRRHHLHSNAPRLLVPGRGDGLGDAESAELATVQHHGGGLLHRGPAGGARPVRSAGHLQTPTRGSQFTSPRFVEVVQGRRRPGLHGRSGAAGWDNVFIERLWRSLKYECVYLHAFETGSELRAGLGRWIGYYKHRQAPTRRTAARPLTRPTEGLSRTSDWRREADLNLP